MPRIWNLRAVTVQDSQFLQFDAAIAWNSGRKRRRIEPIQGSTPSLLRGADLHVNKCFSLPRSLASHAGLVGCVPDQRNRGTTQAGI